MTKDKLGRMVVALLVATPMVLSYNCIRLGGELQQAKMENEQLRKTSNELSRHVQALSAELISIEKRIMEGRK